MKKTLLSKHYVDGQLKNTEKDKRERNKLSRSIFVRIVKLLVILVQLSLLIKDISFRKGNTIISANSKILIFFHLV